MESEVSISTLYQEYGRLMVQKEIIDGQVNSVKRALADAINRQNQVPQPTANGTS